MPHIMIEVHWVILHLCRNMKTYNLISVVFKRSQSIEIFGEGKFLDIYLQGASIYSKKRSNRFPKIQSDRPVNYLKVKFIHKKVLLREGKRHTAPRVTHAAYGDLSPDKVGVPIRS